MEAVSKEPITELVAGQKANTEKFDKLAEAADESPYFSSSTTSRAIKSLYCKSSPLGGGGNAIVKSLIVDNRGFDSELDYGSPVNLISEKRWYDLGSPRLANSTFQFESATGNHIPIIRRRKLQLFRRIRRVRQGFDVQFYVAPSDQVDLLGRDGIKQVGLSIDKLIFGESGSPEIRFEVIDGEESSLLIQRQFDFF